MFLQRFGNLLKKAASTTPASSSTTTFNVTNNNVEQQRAPQQQATTIEENPKEKFQNVHEEAVIATNEEEDLVLVPDPKNFDPEVFCKACEQGDLALVQQLLGEGYDVNAQNNKWGWSPIMWAIYGNHNILAEWLCTNTRCFPDQEDYFGKTALHVACKNGNLDMVKILLKRGADVNYKSVKVDNSWTPLMYASKYGFADVVRHLIRCGANPDVLDYEGKSAFDMAGDDETRDSFRGNELDEEEDDDNASKLLLKADVLICYLSDKPEQINLAKSIEQSLSERNVTSVALLPSNTDFAKITRVLRKCACLVVVLSNEFAEDSKSCQIVNAADGLGTKKFMIALCADTIFPPKGLLGTIFSGKLYQDCSGKFMLLSKSLLDLSTATEQMLVDAMAGITEPTTGGEGEKEAAARRKRILRELKYDPTSAKRNGLFAKGGCPSELIEHSKTGNVSALQLVIEKHSKQSLDLCDGEYERTPLMWSSFYGHLQAVILLINAEASINLIDRKGNHALTLAADRGNEEVIKYLIITGGCNPNFLPPIGSPALHHAAKAGSISTLKLLLSLGAKKMISNHLGQQAVDFANENREILSLLSPRTSVLKAEFSDRDVFISYNWNQQKLCIELAEIYEKIVDYPFGKISIK